MFVRKSIGLSLAAFVAMVIAAPAYAASGNTCSTNGSADSNSAQKGKKAGVECDPHFTYTPGPHGPDHWGGECNVGKVQSPIDITHADPVALPPVTFSYEPIELRVFNDCNHYRVQVLFPTTNRWLTVGTDKYTLIEFHFHEPGEYKVNGHRAAMVIHLVHRSETGGLLAIEIPIEVSGTANPTIQKVLDHVPAPGDQQPFPGVRINVMDLLPADRDYFSLPGSLTTPDCNQGVAWMVLKHPITITQAQLDEYKTHYSNTARPLQQVNDRKIQEPIK